MFRVRYARAALEHLGAVRAYDRTRILDDIDEQLAVEAITETARRKILPGATPSFEHLAPLWQLRVGEFRVFFDVDGPARTVVVRAVLHKGHKTTGEIL
ncbi:MAG: type II toxin-antitoxin system RelE/ParE family toxin [Myxococcota bacterium]